MNRRNFIGKTLGLIGLSSLVTDIPAKEVVKKSVTPSPTPLQNIELFAISDNGEMFFCKPEITIDKKIVRYKGTTEIFTKRCLLVETGIVSLPEREVLFKQAFYRGYISVNRGDYIKLELNVEMKI